MLAAGSLGLVWTPNEKPSHLFESVLWCVGNVPVPGRTGSRGPTGCALQIRRWSKRYPSSRSANDSINGLPNNFAGICDVISSILGNIRYYRDKRGGSRAQGDSCTWAVRSTTCSNRRSNRRSTVVCGLPLIYRQAQARSPSASVLKQLSVDGIYFRSTPLNRSRGLGDRSFSNRATCFNSRMLGTGISLRFKEEITFSPPPTHKPSASGS